MIRTPAHMASNMDRDKDLQTWVILDRFKSEFGRTPKEDMTAPYTVAALRTLMCERLADRGVWL